MLVKNSASGQFQVFPAFCGRRVSVWRRARRHRARTDALCAADGLRDRARFAGAGWQGRRRDGPLFVPVGLAAGWASRVLRRVASMRPPHAVVVDGGGSQRRSQAARASESGQSRAQEEIRRRAAPQHAGQVSLRDFGLRPLGGSLRPRGAPRRRRCQERRRRIWSSAGVR